MVTRLTTIGTSILTHRVSVWAFWLVSCSCHLSLASLEQNERHPLVEIFCTAMVEQSNQQPKSKTIDDVWPELEKHFESGKLFSFMLSPAQLAGEIEKIKSTPIFRKCLDENRKEFEYGEFLISGKKIVHKSLESLQQPSQVILSGASFSFQGSSFLPADMALNFSEPNGEDEKPRLIENVAKREKRYNALWQDFLANLKTRSKQLRF